MVRDDLQGERLAQAPREGGRESCSEEEVLGWVLNEDQSGGRRRRVKRAIQAERAVQVKERSGVPILGSWGGAQAWWASLTP